MRIRSTKPEFWRSKTIAAIPWDVRLVLKGLESYVDDNGVGKDDIALIAADVFPRDLSANARETLARLSEAISVLVSAGLVVRYEVDSEELLYVDNWKEIQRIDKPAKGRYPRPDGSFEYSEPVNRESYAKPRETVARPPEILAPGTGEQGNRGTGEQSCADKPARKSPNGRPSTPRPPDELFDALAAACGIDPKSLTDSGRGALNGALKQLRAVEATPAQITLRARRYREQYRDASLTPSALAKHWAALANGKPAEKREWEPWD